VSRQPEPQREADGYVEFSEWCHIPYWNCDLCGEPARVGEPLTMSDGTVICDECAGEIANRYSYRHSGNYLTWPNDREERTGRNRPKISVGLRQRVMERDHYRCRYCGSHKSLVLDHFLPLSKGGPNDEGNLVTACWSCNSRKGDKLPHESGLTLRPVPGGDV
jgi:hypothetical protein